MEPYNKPTLTYPQQVSLLESRGIRIQDRPGAEKFLSQVNYYRLSAYCLPFELSRHSFRSGTTFEEIRALYEFDRRLRFLADEALEVIEIAMRTATAHYLAKAYGAFVHEDKRNFYEKFDHAGWVEKVHQEAERSKETFISHYRSKYDGFPKLPVWMAVEVMSFGTLSHLYSNMIRDDQKGLASVVGLHSSVLASWLHTFTYVRNICAHHGRIWNRELAIAMTLPKKGRWQDLNGRRIGSVLFAIRYFLLRLPSSDSLLKDWQSRVDALLDQPVQLPDFYGQMGFPEKFKSHELWKSV